jgi:hypothetical protein
MKKKGVSTIVAVVLLVLIAVAGATMIYAYLNWNSLAPNTSAKPLESLTIVGVTPGGADNATIYVENTGTVPCTVGGVYTTSGQVLNEYDQGQIGTVIPVGATVPLVLTGGMDYFQYAQTFEISTTGGNNYYYTYLLPSTETYTYLGNYLATGVPNPAFTPTSGTQNNGTQPGIYNASYGPSAWIPGLTIYGPGYSKVGETSSGSLAGLENGSSTFTVTSLKGCEQGVAGEFQFTGINLPSNAQILNVTFWINDSRVVLGTVGSVSGDISMYYVAVNASVPYAQFTTSTIWTNSTLNFGLRCYAEKDAITDESKSATQLPTITYLAYNSTTDTNFAKDVSFIIYHGTAYLYLCADDGTLNTLNFNYNVYQLTMTVTYSVPSS